MGAIPLAASDAHRHDAAAAVYAFQCSHECDGENHPCPFDRLTRCDGVAGHVGVPGVEARGPDDGGLTDPCR